MKTKLVGISAMVVLLALLLTVAAGCGGEDGSEKAEAAAKVSGVFHGETELLGEDQYILISFSFHEADEATIDGGVRVKFLGDNGDFQRYSYKAEHALTNWERTPDGNVLIAGSVDLGSELGEFTFGGEMIGTDFHYAFASDFGEGEGIAHRAGDYILGTPNFVGSYTISNGPATMSAYCCYPAYTPDGTKYGKWGHFSSSIDAFSLTLVITSQKLNDMGGLDLSGYYEGNIPKIGSGRHDLDQPIDWWAGDWNGSTDQCNFNSYTQSWHPDKSDHAQLGYCIDDTVHSPCVNQDWSYQGSLTISAKK